MVRNKNNLNLKIIPDPILRKKSKNLSLSEIKNRKFLDFIKNMSILMDEYQGIGLSAVQVGFLKNFFIIKKELDKEKISNYLEDIEVFINPEILEYSQEVEENWEGCLSIPGIECLVPRSKKIKVKYLDLEANLVEKYIDDFKAIVFQHEYDHTRGILIIDKAKKIREIK